MKIKTPLEFQTFNDGVCSINCVKNVAEPGDKPREGLETKYGRIPFERRKVGLQRFYQAMQADVQITDLIRIPYQMNISTNDVCVIKDRQYLIKQVQAIKDTLPASTDLTLERLEVDYDTNPV